MGKPVTDFASLASRGGPRRPIVPAAVGALLVGAIVWAAAPAGAAAPIVVNCPTTDLQRAIDAAPARATLQVRGTCTGTFSIGKTLRLVGRRTAVLDGNNAGNPLIIGSGVTVGLANLTIQNAGRGTGFPRSGLRNEGANVTLRHVTVTQNHAGLDGPGGISNNGSMVLYDSTVTGNSAEFGGGIRNAGTLTLRKSSVTGNGGGGINNTGRLTLYDSTVSDNGGHLGAGGIYNTGTAMLRGSSVTGNVDSLEGTGGIYNSGRITLDDSRVTGNTGYSGTGGIHNDGTVTLKHSPVTGNASYFPGAATGTGGIFNAGTVTLQNSPVIDNVPNNCRPPGSVVGCSG